MNVDQPSAGSVSTRNEVNAKAAKTTTKNQSSGRADRGRGAMLGANSTAKAKMLFGLGIATCSRATIRTSLSMDSTTPREIFDTSLAPNARKAMLFARKYLER